MKLIKLTMAIDSAAYWVNPSHLVCLIEKEQLIMEGMRKVVRVYVTGDENSGGTCVFETVPQILEQLEKL